MIPRNLTLPLSEHPLSSILVLNLHLSVNARAFTFRRGTILHHFVHVPAMKMAVKRKVADKEKALKSTGEDEGQDQPERTNPQATTG